MAKRCGSCGEEKDESEFNRRSRGRVGLQGRCRKCNSEYLKRHYRDNPEYYKAKARRTTRRIRAKNQTRIREFFAANPCVDCGERDPVVLQFDHVRGEKLFNIGSMIGGTVIWSKVEAEIAKCEVRCANCHWRKTAKQFNWYAYLTDETSTEDDPSGVVQLAERRPLVPDACRFESCPPSDSARTAGVTRALDCVVLAAGEGKRMRSARPKPLHLLCGRAMLLHILDAVSEMGAERAVIVVGHGAERITKKLIEDGPVGLPIDFVEQSVQRGTGDAVMVALTGFPDDDDEDGDLVVVPSDHPLLRATTLASLVQQHRETGSAATVLTARVDEPAGYGRVVRSKDGGVQRIVEQRDADAEQQAIDEINLAIYCFKRSLLAPALRRVTPNNVQGEYYLTDVIEVLAEAGHLVGAMQVDDPAEAAGVNDRQQLAAAEAELRRRTNERWMAAGVTMVDPSQTYLDTAVRLAADVTLFPGVILQGATTVGERSEIGPGTRLIDCNVGSDCRLDQTYAERSDIGDGSRVGPFAFLAPGTSIAAGTATGAFYTASGAET